MNSVRSIIWKQQKGMAAIALWARRIFYAIFGRPPLNLILYIALIWAESQSGAIQKPFFSTLRGAAHGPGLHDLKSLGAYHYECYGDDARDSFLNDFGRPRATICVLLNYRPYFNLP